MSPVVWTLFGNLHFGKNEWMPAQKKFEYILAKMYNNKTPDPYSLIGLGNVWFEQLLNPSRKKEDEKKYIDRALQMYQKALKLEPKNMYAANGIGCVLAYKRNWNDARDVFSQVRESTSEFYDVWLNIAHVFMEREQWMSAVQMYSSAMKKFRKESDVVLLHYLAKAYYRANMLTEAKETLEKAMMDQMDNTQLKFNYAIVLRKSAKEILRGHKMTSQQVKSAINDLTFAEMIFNYISKNDDRQASHIGMRISRTVCSDEAKNCKDLLTQAKQKLTTAQSQDEEERRLQEKQEKEKIALKNKLMEEARAREEAERKRIEDAKNLRLSFIEMTKDVLRLPEIVEEKRRGGGGRKRRNDDGDEFVNDSSDAGNYDGEEGGEDGERIERRKKDKAAKKASRKKRERRDSDGSDSNRREEKKKKRKEDRARKMEERLSAKQQAKIKSRAFLSSSESSDDDKPKPAAESSEEEEETRPPVDEFDSPRTDSDEDSDHEAATKKKKKKAVVDSDADSDDSDGDRPIIGGSDDDDDDKPAARGVSSGSDSDSPKKKTESQLEVLCDLLDNAENGTIVGYDSEFRPSHLSDTNAIRIATLQLFFNEKAYLIDCVELENEKLSDKMWIRMFQSLFGSKQITVAGFDMRHDLESLFSIKPIRDQFKVENIQNFVCVRRFSELLNEMDMNILNLSKKSCRLTNLAEELVEIKMDKSEQNGNWQSRPLRKNQIIYATLDAVAVLKVFLKVLKLAKNVEPALDIEKLMEDARNFAIVKKERIKRELKVINAHPWEDVYEIIHTHRDDSKPLQNPSDLKIVMDTMVLGLGKNLRLLGVDVYLPRDANDFLKHLQIMKDVFPENQRIIVTVPSKSYETLREENPNAQFIVLQNVYSIRNPLDLLTSFLDLFNLDIRKENGFAKLES